MSLSKTSVGMSLIVAQALARKGIQLGSVPNTPLQVLTDLSTQQLVIEEGIALEAGGFERPSLSVSLLSGAETPMPGTDVSPHTAQMDDAVAMLERVLNNTLDLTQNVVNPTIERVHTALVEASDKVLEGGGSPLTIVEQNYDPIFDSVYLVESVTRYRAEQRVVPLKSLNVRISDVWAGLSTGHAGMDDQLQQFLKRQGEELAIETWNAMFYQTPADTSDVFSRLEQANRAVFAYFFAAKARMNPPAEANIELSEWRAYCSNLLAAAGASICAVFEAREGDRKFGRMVLSYPTDSSPTGQVLVNGDKYRVWLSQGGTPELIFSTIYGDRNFDPKRMIDRAERLRADWENVSSLYANTVSYKRFDAVIERLRSILSAEIAAFKDEDLPVEREAYHVRLRELAHKVKQRDLQDLWHLSRSAVCQVLYPHTDAETLLLAIDEQDKLHPEKSVRELALYATIELVANWLAGQIVARQQSPL